MAEPSSAVQVEGQATSFSCLPPHLQSLILAFSGAPLNTCKAAAAIPSDARLLALWLRARQRFPVLRASLLQLWDACQHLLSSNDLVFREQELQLAMVSAARCGQLQLVTTLLQLVRLPPGPTVAEHKQHTTSLGRGGQPNEETLRNDPYTAANFLHPLAAAAAGGHLKICKVLLTAGVTAVTALDAMCKAAANGHLEVLQLIEAWGELLGEDFTIGHDPLRHAAEGGHLPTLNYLLDKALQEPKPPGNDSSIIRHVVTSCKGSFEVLQLILGRQELQWGRSEWVAAMRAAAKSGLPRSVALILSNMSPELRSWRAFWEMDPPLCTAAFHGHLEVVKLLLQEGFGSQQCRQQALRDAAEGGHIPVMQFLIEQGADIHNGEVGFSHDGPLGMAVQSRQPAAAQWLIEQGAATGDLALVCAVRRAYPPDAVLPMCKLLLQCDTQDPSGHALFEAARCGYGEVVQLLLKQGSEAPQTEEEQLFRWEVALCGAASMGRVEVVKDLLAAMPQAAAASAHPAQDPSVASAVPGAAAGPLSSTTAPAVGNSLEGSAPEAPGSVAELGGEQPGTVSSVQVLSPNMAQGISRALAAARAGEDYRRPEHLRCSWPAYEEDEGLSDWEYDLLRDGYDRCGTPCDRQEVVRLLQAAAGKPWA